MALFYKAVKSTMATKSGDKKWHLNLVKVGKVVSTQQLAEMIAEKSSLTPGDVQVAALLCHFTPEYTRPAAIGTTRALFQGVEFQKASGIGASGNNGSGGGDGDIVDDQTA